MIRYIDIGNQLTKDKRLFAWFDSEFMFFDGNQIWSDWDEFELDFWCEMDYLTEDGVPVDEPRKYLERFKKLFPKKQER